MRPIICWPCCASGWSRAVTKSSISKRKSVFSVRINKFLSVARKNWTQSLLQPAPHPVRLKYLLNLTLSCSILPRCSHCLDLPFHVHCYLCSLRKPWCSSHDQTKKKIKTLPILLLKTLHHGRLISSFIFFSARSSTRVWLAVCAHTHGCFLKTS